MTKPKQSVNARITREANETIEMWKKVYGGRNKSEAIRNVNLLLFAKLHGESKEN